MQTEAVNFAKSELLAYVHFCTISAADGIDQVDRELLVPLPLIGQIPLDLRPPPR